MTGESGSVVRVHDVLIASVPSDPVDRTVSELREEVLSRLHEAGPGGVILDLSAVHVMDSFFARTIAETARMIRLLGGEPIVVGIRPSVALTAAELGYDLGDIETARTTDQALDMLGLTMESAGDDGR
ncbi:MAG: STAS domain-containing protein [Halobacteriales archaeon]